MAEQKEEKLTVLAGYVQRLGEGFAHVAKTKGAQDLVPIQSLWKWMTNLGLNDDMVVRTDSEVSIRTLANVGAQKTAPANTLVDEVGVNIPILKGGVEGYIATLAGDVRALKMIIEERWTISVHNGLSVFPWMIRHAA